MIICLSFAYSGGMVISYMHYAPVKMYKKKLASSSLGWASQHHPAQVEDTDTEFHFSDCAFAAFNKRKKKRKKNLPFTKSGECETLCWAGPWEAGHWVSSICREAQPGANTTRRYWIGWTPSSGTRIIQCPWQLALFDLRSWRGIWKQIVTLREPVSL